MLYVITDILLKVPLNINKIGLHVNLILYLFNEDCQHPMATSGFPQNTYMYMNT